MSSEWTLTTALEQIDKCGFECEGGPLSNNVAYRWLKEAAQNGPKFLPGQQVWFEIDATAAGKRLAQLVCFTVVGCTMSSDTDGRTWAYSLSYDPPSAWHYGKTHFTGIDERRLLAAPPEKNATEAEANAAIAVLERAIEAARNSNQAGENAVVRAAASLAPSVADTGVR